MIDDPHLILSSAELAELTGYVQHAAQARWLAGKGWTFALDCRSRPRVDRRYYESRMGHNSETTSSTEPDFSALYA